jgi:hypothetical protein
MRPAVERHQRTGRKGGRTEESSVERLHVVNETSDRPSRLNKVTGDDD